MADSPDNQPEPRYAPEDDIDGDLLARVANRDRDALTQLYARYHGPLLRFTQRLTGDIETAQEAVNDVMLVVWQNASGFAGRSRVSTWIMGIAYRKAMKLRTRLQRWAVRFKAADWANVVEPTAGTEEHTPGLAESDLMYRAIQLLPPKQRAVVELTYYFGHSYDEIAEIVGCPTNTVKTRMFHARARLRQLLPLLGHDAEA